MGSSPEEVTDRIITQVALALAPGGWVSPAEYALLRAALLSVVTAALDSVRAEERMRAASPCFLPRENS